MPMTTLIWSKEMLFYSAFTTSHGKSGCRGTNDYGVPFSPRFGGLLSVPQLKWPGSSRSGPLFVSIFKINSSPHSWALIQGVSIKIYVPQNNKSPFMAHLLVGQLRQYFYPYPWLILCEKPHNTSAGFLPSNNHTDSLVYLSPLGSAIKPWYYRAANSTIRKKMNLILGSQPAFAAFFCCVSTSVQ